MGELANGLCCRITDPHEHRTAGDTSPGVGEVGPRSKLHAVYLGKGTSMCGRRMRRWNHGIVFSGLHPADRCRQCTAIIARGPEPEPSEP